MEAPGRTSAKSAVVVVVGGFEKRVGRGEQSRKR